MGPHRILAAASAALGQRVVSYSPAGGGSIAQTGVIETQNGQRYILKTGFPGRMFPCEANGLGELAKPGVIRTPVVAAANDRMLIIEYIAQSLRPKDFFQRFGQSLARLHRTTAENFGFYEDNFIGATPQPNRPEDDEASDWTAFYLNKRLLYQYRLAERNGYASARLRTGFLKLESRIASLLEGSEEPPALLHGDLWGGNYLCDERGDAVLIDPAVYYGHREAELAMTKLFGGFSPEFYRAYQQEYPLKEGWQRREGLYLLYHVMNHLNLFGTGYLSQAERILGEYV